MKPYRIFSFFVPLVLLFSTALPAQASQTSNSVRTGRELGTSYGAVPLGFELNQGQTDAEVDFLARAGGYLLFLTPTEAVMAFDKSAAQSDKWKREEFLSTDSNRATPPRLIVRMQLEGANPAASAEGLDELVSRANYFSGPDPSQWHTDIPSYARVRYAQVYPGIDMVFYGNQRQLEYDFVIAPGSDPDVIQIVFSGIEGTEISRMGDLLLRTAQGDLRQSKPIAYQERNGSREEVSASYIRKGVSGIGFQLGDYDRSRPLIIDPVLVYSTYLGGNGFDQGYAIVVDSSGSAYVTGRTHVADFPTTPGAFQTTFGGGDALFVAKLNPQGTALVYSTYINGAYGNGIAVDSAGNAYVTGEASTLNFPTTPGAFQTEPYGFDTFVTKLNATGSALVYSARFGGNFDDFGRAIALDAAGNAYITGWTVCLAPTCTFPTVNAFQPNYGGGYNDAFVTKINSLGSALVYSTYLGGGQIINATDDWGEGIAVDSAGSAYVTGYTYSPDFPVTPGAYDTSRAGLDAFITKFTPDGVSLVYSTFLGGAGREQGQAIAVDANGNTYITGTTESFDNPFTKEYEGLPVTPGAFQTVGSYDAFITKLNPQGSALVYSTYLGGAADVDRGWGIKVDAAGNTYVVGDTKSSNFPNVNAIQPAYGGGLGDAFVSKLSSTGSSLVYSTFLGGNLTDEGRGIALDSNANAYVTGLTSSFQFPVSGPFQGTNGGGINSHDDAFVAKIGDSTSIPAADLSLTMTDSPDPAGMGSNVTYTLTVSNAGPVTATAVALTVRLDGLFRVVSITPSQGTCGAPDAVNMFTCNLGSIATGSTARVTAVATMPQATGSLLSDAFVSGNEIDPNNTNNSASQVTTVTTNPTPYPVLSSLTLNPTSVIGGQTLQATVTLSGPVPAGGAVVILSSSNGAASVPASITVPASAISASFTVTTSPVASATSVTIAASYNNSNASATLWIGAATPTLPTLSAISLNPTSVRGGSASTGTVTLSAPAPSGGAVISLISSNPSIAIVPAGITVPAGATSASFSVTTRRVSRPTSVVISAEYNNTSVSATLNLTRK
jgi:uncharacterized repeat protein (TIGR01451 family)